MREVKGKSVHEKWGILTGEIFVIHHKKAHMERKVGIQNFESFGKIQS